MQPRSVDRSLPLASHPDTRPATITTAGNTTPAFDSIGRPHPADVARNKPESPSSPLTGDTTTPGTDPFGTSPTSPIGPRRTRHPQHHAHRSPRHASQKPSPARHRAASAARAQPLPTQSTRTAVTPAVPPPRAPPAPSFDRSHRHASRAGHPRQTPEATPIPTPRPTHRHAASTGLPTHFAPKTPTPLASDFHPPRVPAPHSGLPTRLAHKTPTPLTGDTTYPESRRTRRHSINRPTGPSRAQDTHATQQRHHLSRVSLPYTLALGIDWSHRHASVRRLRQRHHLAPAAPPDPRRPKASTDSADTLLTQDSRNTTIAVAQAIPPLRVRTHPPAHNVHRPRTARTGPRPSLP